MQHQHIGLVPIVEHDEDGNWVLIDWAIVGDGDQMESVKEETATSVPNVAAPESTTIIPPAACPAPAAPAAPAAVAELPQHSTHLFRETEREPRRNTTPLWCSQNHRRSGLSHALQCHREMRLLQQRQRHQRMQKQHRHVQRRSQGRLNQPQTAKLRRNGI